jgi:hypothetical protein
LKNNKNGISVINNTKYNLKEKISLDKKSVLILEVS